MSYSMPNQILKDDLVVLYANRQTGGFAHKEYFVGVKKVDYQIHESYVLLLTGDKQAGKFYKIESKKGIFQYIEVDDIYNSQYSIMGVNDYKKFPALEEKFVSKDIYLDTLELINTLNNENTRQKNIAIEKKKVRDEQWLKALAPTNENEKPEKILKEDLVVLSVERKSGEITYNEYFIGIERYNHNSSPDIYLLTGNEGVGKFHKSVLNIYQAEEYIEVKEDNENARLNVVRVSNYDTVPMLLDIYNDNDIYVDVNGLEKCLKQENERQYTIAKVKNEIKDKAWINVIAENKMPDKILKDDLAILSITKRVGDISYKQYVVGIKRYNPSIKDFDIFLLTGEKQDTGKFYVEKQGTIESRDKSTQYSLLYKEAYKDVPNLLEMYEDPEYYVDTNALLDCIEKQNKTEFERYEIRNSCWNSINNIENQEESNNEM